MIFHSSNFNKQGVLKSCGEYEKTWKIIKPAPFIRNLRVQFVLVFEATG